MKRILLFSCLFVFAAACSTQPSGNKDTPVNANKSADSKSTGAVSEADIIAKEKASWDAIKKKDWDGFAKMLASDYFEVLDDGVHDKAKSVESVKDFDLSDISYADWKMLPIDKDALIITYSVTVKANFKGQPAPPGPYREASVYVNRNGEWITVFYQETLSRPPMAQPSPGKEPAKSATSPMAKPADAGSDPIADEKLVWDALKSKNYDGFGSYLANDSMEIEAEGVYDKAGSIKGASMFDFSKTELSDWKTLKFDDDASVVTYVVKMPPMPGMAGTEYHSTIWVRRDGKWQALFHQGTPAAPAEEKK